MFPPKDSKTHIHISKLRSKFEVNLASAAMAELLELASFNDGGNIVRYDEVGKQLLLLKHHEFEAIPFGPSTDPGAPPSATCPNNGPVLDVRFAPPPLRWVAVQRSPAELELRELDSGSTHTHRLRPNQSRPGRILAFHWTGSAVFDLVVVSTRGADFLALHQGGLKLVRSVALAVSWCLYSHETRIVLLATGKHDSEVHGMQIQPTGIVRIPHFTVALPTPTPTRHPRDDGPPITSSSPARSLNHADVTVVCLHGRIYLCHTDGPSRQLVLYQLFRDYVVRKHVIPLPSEDVSVSQLDSLLLVHCRDADVSMIFDLRINAQQPIVAPLPIGPRPREGASPRARLRRLGAQSSRWAHWTLVPPNYVVDHAVGRVYEFTLDLDVIVASPLDWVRRTQCLLGRRGGDAQLRTVVCQALHARTPAAILRSVWHLLNGAWAQVQQQGGRSGEQHAIPSRAPSDGARLSSGALLSASLPGTPVQLRDAAGEDGSGGGEDGEMSSPPDAAACLVSPHAARSLCFGDDASTTPTARTPDVDADRHEPTTMGSAAELPALPNLRPPAPLPNPLGAPAISASDPPLPAPRSPTHRVVRARRAQKSRLSPASMASVFADVESAVEPSYLASSISEYLASSHAHG
jgi:hypothetical protein